MKRSLAFTLSFILSVLGLLGMMGLQSANASPLPEQIAQITPAGPVAPQSTVEAVEGAVHGYYFYGNDCPHCIAVLEDVLSPLMAEHGGLLDMRLLEIGTPEYYEALLAVEAHFEVPVSERSIPTLVVGDQILIGETSIRETFPDILSTGLDQGGIGFPDIEGINPAVLISISPEATETVDEICGTDEACEVDAPLYIAYFYQTGCDECSRVTADLNYLRSKYPQIQVEEFNIYDSADLATWLTEKLGYTGDFHTPALFIGEDVLVGDEIYLENITATLDSYLDTGTQPLWLDYDAQEGQQNIIERFSNMGWLTVVIAGLVDGINPCAFATLIFFVSYLTLSGRRGKEVLIVGAAFTIGVFLAYLAVGLGLYKVLELIGSTLEIVSNIVYAVTGVFCLVLAVLSFLDYRKAKNGQIEDMMLNLPEPLRKRINATIRKGRNTSNYAVGAFFAGVLISFLELACTGQVYLPTIIFVSSIPEMRLRALLYLIIYNLLFILPLVVIFVLVYYGTTSKDLTKFLQERAALVKLIMGFIFIALGGWLILSLIF